MIKVYLCYSLKDNKLLHFNLLFGLLIGDCRLVSTGVEIVPSLVVIAFGVLTSSKSLISPLFLLLTPLKLFK